MAQIAGAQPRKRLKPGAASGYASTTAPQQSYRTGPCLSEIEAIAVDAAEYPPPAFETGCSRNWPGTRPETFRKALARREGRRASLRAGRAFAESVEFPLSARSRKEKQKRPRRAICRRHTPGFRSFPR